MTPSTIARTLVACPGCARTVGLPAGAVGKAVTCPHCGTAFHVLASLAVVAGPPPGRFAAGLPRGFIVPVFGLLMLGFAGVAVDGYLTYLFATKPGADYEYAYNRVVEARSIQSVGDTTAAASDEWEQLPAAAAMGAALPVSRGDLLEEAANVRLATAWRPAVAPASRYSLAASALAILGGVCMARGRFYWLAALGCVAAIVNVNHLCCLPGGVTGVWGLLMIVRDEGRLHFGITPKQR